MTKDSIIVDASRIATMLSLAVLLWLGATVNSLSVEMAVLSVKLDEYTKQVDDVSRRLDNLSAKFDKERSGQR